MSNIKDYEEDLNKPESLFRIGLMTSEEECLENLYIEIEQTNGPYTIEITYLRKYETTFTGID